MSYVLIEDNKILASANWHFPNSVYTDKNVVRGKDGQLYFEEDISPINVMNEDDVLEQDNEEYIKLQRIGDIKKRLAEIDNESIRPLRAKAASISTLEDMDKLVNLEQEAAKLREELKELQGV